MAFTLKGLIDGMNGQTSARILRRDVTQAECPWLDADMAAGTHVFEFYGATYGCIGHNGVAVTKEDQENPFFEIPANALLTAPTTA